MQFRCMRLAQGMAVGEGYHLGSHIITSSPRAIENRHLEYS